MALVRPIICLIVLAAAAACAPESEERPLPIAVVDTSALEIVDRVSAPRNTFDVAYDDATGSVWTISEGRTARVSEIPLDGKPVLRHTLDLQMDSLGKGYWLDSGAIAIDTTARRAAFTSPRSSQLVLFDLDTGEPLREIVSDYLAHSTVFDPRNGVGYSSSGLPYAFQTSDGEVLASDICVGGPPLVVSSSGLLYAPYGPLFGDSSICRYDPEVGVSSLPAAIGAAAKGAVLSPDGQRLYIAYPSTTQFFAEASMDLPIFQVLDMTTLDWEIVGGFAGAHGFEISPDGTRLFVTNVACNRVSVYDSTSFLPTHVMDIAMEGETMGMDLTADGTRLYVTQVERRGPLGDGEGFLDRDDGADCPPLLEP